MVVDIIFVLFIFLSIFWGTVNIARCIYKTSIPFWNFAFMAIGLTGVITHIIGVW